MSTVSATNARWLIISQVCTKLGDLLCNAKTTLPWLVLSLGGSTSVVALLVPVRESGSMLPQVAIAPWVQRIRPRRRAAIAALLAQGLAALAIAAIGLFASGFAAGVGIIVAVGVMALARALASLSNKDVLARAVHKGARGLVGGRATSLAGLLGLGGAAMTLTLEQPPDSAGLLAIVIAGACVAFGLSAAALTGVSEEDDETGDDAQRRPSLRAALADARLRRFVLVRILLTGSALGGPFIVTLGRQETASLQTLSAFVLAGGAASFVSAAGWGRLADISGRGCMAAGGALAAAVAGSTVGLGSVELPTWAWAGLYFAFSIGYVGVRVGRKTYVVDIAEGGARTQFVASSNTLVALALLAVGGGLAALPSPSAALVACGVATGVGALGCLTLAKAS